MVSQAKGYLRVPVWIDSGIVKPIVNNAGQVPVSIESANISFNTNLKSYVDNNWHKQPLIFSYTNRITNKHSYTKPGSGDYTFTVRTVPAGKVEVITHVTAYSEDGWLDRIEIFLDQSGYYPMIFMKQSPQAYELVGGSCNLVLQANDRVRIRFVNCALGETVVGGVQGYAMKLET